ncbi:hypothetical protein E1B28_011029 [Marasmius oreades]|uniref:Uncharacterized protein n=1 Tax=Marasmius oreades TaxID=181124 RepID=A0A9P7RTY4_9AGAR|nr:uncharacterized protein E1B28_011029 [Marasmius oreades]KAG7089335.1 hypothetical protein E1B28_011029 [Marasmius oreades]
MPTAMSTPTATMTVSKKSLLKTLRLSYNSAAKAFLNRNIKLTHSLIQSTFDTLNNGFSHSCTDALHILRKWDILRITLETTVYSAPPPNVDFPDELRQMSLKIPSTLVQDMYRRSLKSFSSETTSPSAVLLPVQVISTLVYSSLKLDAAQVGREIIEEWLARRNNTLAYFPTSTDGDGYEKVLELYCLHLLPKLEDWEYAAQFLEYESELGAETRTSLQNSLRTQHVQAVSSRLPPPVSSQLSTSSVPSRTQSPTPSSSSSSSSLSTTSTHTVTPPTPRPYRGLPQQPSMTSLASSVSSGSSEGTVTPNGNGHIPNGGTVSINGNGYAHHHRIDKGKQSSRPGTSGNGSLLNHTNASTSSSPPARIQSHHPLNPHSPNPLSLPRSHVNRVGGGNGRMSTYALIKASLEPYWSRLANMGGSRISALIFMVVLPVVSLVLRWRTRRRLSAGSMTIANNADVVRRKLRNVNASDNQVKAVAMMLVKMWWAFLRSILDTVRMGVSGLV